MARRSGGLPKSVKPRPVVKISEKPKMSRKAPTKLAHPLNAPRPVGTGWLLKG